MNSVPAEMRGKLEPAEIYHQVLEHRWFLSERAAREIPIEEAAQSYITTVLGGLPDEAVALAEAESLGPLANPYDPSEGFADDEATAPYDPWEQGDEAPDSGTEPARAYLDIDALRRARAKG